MPQLALVKHQLPHFCQNSRQKNQCLICKQRIHLKRQEIAQSMLVKIEKWPRLWEEGPIMHKSYLLISLMRWEDLLLPSVLMMVISWSLIRRFNSKPISVRRKPLFLKTANKKTTQCAQALTKRMKIRNQILKKLSRSMLMWLKKWMLGLEDHKLAVQLVDSANLGAKLVSGLIVTDLRISIKPMTHSHRCSIRCQRSLKNWVVCQG